MNASSLLPWKRPRNDAAPRRDGQTGVLALQQDINRMFDTFWRGFNMPIRGAWDIVTAEELPRVDVRETDKDVVVTAELAGMDGKDVEISVAGGLLTIRGQIELKRETDEDSYLLRERSVGTVARVVALPDGLDLDSAQATMKNGLLTLTLPRTMVPTPAGAKQVAIARA